MSAVKGIPRAEQVREWLGKLVQCLTVKAFYKLYCRPYSYLQKTCKHFVEHCLPEDRAVCGCVRDKENYLND